MSDANYGDEERVRKNNDHKEPTGVQIEGEMY